MMRHLALMISCLLTLAAPALVGTGDAPDDSDLYQRGPFDRLGL